MRPMGKAQGKVTNNSLALGWIYQKIFANFEQVEGKVPRLCILNFY